MSVFADNSALYALLVHNEKRHAEAAAEFTRLVQSGASLVTTSYVVLEAVVLLQHRIGLPVVRDFEENIVPTLRIAWVTEELHRRGVNRLFRENRRQLSLVDCVSLEFIEAEGLRDVFGFDSHFAQAGCRLLPQLA